MISVLTLPSLVSLALLPMAMAGNLRAQNNCGFTIWCASARNAPPGQPTGPPQSPTQAIGPGEPYVGSYPATNDDIGVVLKCGLSADLLVPYQLELAINPAGLNYLDLSHDDGSPFIDYRRRAEIPGTSCVLDCAPGDASCEYPNLVTCVSNGDATMTLC